MEKTYSRSSSSRGQSSRRNTRSNGGSSDTSPQKNKRRRPASSRGGARRGKGGGSSRTPSSTSTRGGNRSRRGRVIPTFDPSQFINTNPIELKEEVYTARHAFADFDLDTEVLSHLKRMGIITPSPIQDQTIIPGLEGRDVVGLAETGTGKTAAFLLPLIHKTLKDRKSYSLILAPTRELAIQIADELRNLTRGMKIFSVTCVGGMNIRPQIQQLRRHHHFVIGTPGRVLDLINRDNIQASRFGAIVLDEADRMLDMGFIHDIRAILKSTPNNRQTLFFSATMDDRTETLIHEFLKDPVIVSVKKKDVTNSIEQNIVPHGHHNKFETLTDLFKDPSFDRVIIFGAMKHSVEKLSQELSRAGIRANSIHGNKNHRQRVRALDDFKKGEARVLVATDVAARGIHVDDVSHVINYDLPQTFEDYVHRIGRTGRGKKKGKALTFVHEK
ncbi:DEAD/DEAH box helicase [Candidatus Nomurabacteria bacterium]|nr:DEAD/DEAH box helicase [Candidatus Nomurabacteria bacterium]